MCFPVVIYVVEVRKSGHLFDGFFVKITIGFYVLLRPHISFFISSIFFEGSSNLKKSITTTGYQMNCSKSRKNKNPT